MNSVQVRVATAFAAGAIIGGGTAYILTKKKYRDIANAEVADIKAEYTRRSEEDYLKNRDPEMYNEWLKTQGREDEVKERPLTKEEIEERINSAYDAKLDNLGYAEKADLETEGLPTQWAANDATEDEPIDIDDDPALWERDFEKPYIINVNEFNTEHMDNPNWEKVSLTYYDGDTDDVLAPEDGQAITDVDGIVGLVNLMYFGVGSQDKNIVYIRNENIDTDFEITRANGSYTELALGINQWNENEDTKPKVKKMRGDGN